MVRKTDSGRPKKGQKGAKTLLGALRRTQGAQGRGNGWRSVPAGHRLPHYASPYIPSLPQCSVSARGRGGGEGEGRRRPAPVRPAGCGGGAPATTGPSPAIAGRGQGRERKKGGGEPRRHTQWGRGPADAGEGGGSLPTTVGPAGGDHGRRRLITRENSHVEQSNDSKRTIVQPARRQWTYSKAKKTYGGLDKESLAQSRVFPMERWSKLRGSV
ncbi:hypothetical protein Taro_047808 [Colocasia esculenta]|uniref:Uncharacterized protein n=1 Tax=Colocasia esculenta TaxID=4460 RepID=A0A843X7G6_COLES|nr:hypothetical protein [Colocasia esculenta]